MKITKESVIDFIKTLLVALITVFVLTRFFFIPIVVDGKSMMSNLQDGNRGLSFIITKNIGVHRFDTVVIENELTQKKLVKRIIGLPGETIRYSENRLYVNDVEVPEPFLDEGTMTADFSLTLMEDEYYCLGDNRPVSRDSRFYGPFHLEDFCSSHVLVLWPLNQIAYKQ